MSDPDKNVLTILNVVGSLLTGIASILLIEKGWNLLSISILLIGLLFIFLAFKKFHQINKNGSIMAFIFSEKKSIHERIRSGFCFLSIAYVGLIIFIH